MRKIIAVALTALTLTAATSSAHAKGWGKGWGPGIGFGIGLGLIGAAAATAAYAAPCERVPLYDAYGNYRGSRFVCY
jgi:hypothetical protein